MGDDEHQGPVVASRAEEEPLNELERAGIDPVRIVEHQDHRQAARVAGGGFEHAA